MTNQRGSIVVILLAILALLAIGGGAYYEMQQKVASTEEQQANKMTALNAIPIATTTPLPAEQAQQTSSSSAEDVSADNPPPHAPDTTFSSPDGSFVASVTSGPAPLKVAFAIGQQSVNVTFDFGDGTDLTTACPGSEQTDCVPYYDVRDDRSIAVTHTYVNPGTYTAIAEGGLSAGELGRIVINVSGKQPEVIVPGMSEYTDPQNRFSFSYPADLVVTDNENFFPFNTNGIALKFPDSYIVADSSIQIDGISFGVSNDTSAQCRLVDGYDPADSYDVDKPSEVTMHGILFERGEISDCGAGSCEDVTQYSTFHNGVCYQADLALEVVDPGGYADATEESIQASGAANAVEGTNLQKVFDSIMSTFQLGQ